VSAAVMRGPPSAQAAWRKKYLDLLTKFLCRSRGKALRSNVVFAVGAVVLVLLRFVVFHFIKRGPETLVMYVIGFDDPESINNINYFLEHGVRCGL